MQVEIVLSISLRNLSQTFSWMHRGVGSQWKVASPSGRLEWCHNRVGDFFYLSSEVVLVRVEGRVSHPMCECWRFVTFSLDFTNILFSQ